MPAIDSGWALGSVHPNEARLGELIVERFPSIDAGALHELGHRGQPDGVGARPPPHRPAHDPGVPRRLPRRRAHVRARRPRPSRCRTTGCWPTTTTSTGSTPCSTRTATTSRPCWSSRCRARAAASPAIAEFLQLLRDRCDATRRGAGVRRGDDLALGPRWRTTGARHRPPTSRRSASTWEAACHVRRVRWPRATLMAALRPGSTGGALGHAGTFNNNVVSMAAGVATLSEVLDAGGARGGQRARRTAPDAARRGVRRARRADVRHRARFADEHPRHTAARSVPRPTSPTPTIGGRRCCSSPRSMPATTSPGGDSSPCRSRSPTTTSTASSGSSTSGRHARHSRTADFDLIIRGGSLLDGTGAAAAHRRRRRRATV